MREYIEKGAGGGREAGDGRRRAARRARPRLFRASDRLLRTCARHDDRPGGDLRPGAGDDPVRGRGGRGPDRERLDLRSRRRRLVGRRGARQARGRADSHRPGRDQRRRRSTRWRRSAATSSRATAASSAATASRSSSWRSRCRCSSPSGGGGRLGSSILALHLSAVRRLFPGAAPEGGPSCPPFFRPNAERPPIHRHRDTARTGRAGRRAARVRQGGGRAAAAVHRPSGGRVARAVRARDESPA